MPASQKTYLVSVKYEIAITVTLRKCSMLYSDRIFLSNIRKWWRTSHLCVTSPSPNHVQIKPNMSSGYTDFLMVHFSDWASLMRNCSVPQRQVINVFWKVFLIKAWLTLFLCGVCVHARKSGAHVLLKKLKKKKQQNVELHYSNLILMLQC